VFAGVTQSRGIECRSRHAEAFTASNSRFGSFNVRTLTRSSVPSSGRADDIDQSA
jgi:hypothetical protein